MSNEMFDDMTLRQYAAIHLRVPNSGDDWLDEMITEARRLDFAGQAMQSHLWRDKWKNPFTPKDLLLLAGDSHDTADAMLAERKQASEKPPPPKPQPPSNVETRDGDPQPDDPMNYD